MQVEDQIIASGAQIIWVLQADRSYVAGTAQSCRDYLDSLGSNVGICVGDGETQPTAGTFANSPFTVGRGFDAIVTRDDMKIVWQSSHGTPSGNENLDGSEVLAAVESFVGGN